VRRLTCNYWVKRSWVILLFLLVAAARAVDLSSIDRTIRKEPIYKNTPGYCLLVFGLEAKTRVWVVQDGDRMYVDRNADGDLTASNEAIDASKVRNANSSYRDKEYVIGTIAPPDKTGPHTDFKITAYSEDAKSWNYVLKLKLNGKIQQFAGWKPVFKETPQKAPILHFGGPLGAQAIRHPNFSLKDKSPELSLRFATDGLGEFSTVSLGHEAVSRTIQPVVEIKWPGSKTETVRLLDRC